jgi:hypothetical protein
VRVPEVTGAWVLAFDIDQYIEKVTGEQNSRPSAVLAITTESSDAAP